MKQSMDAHLHLGRSPWRWANLFYPRDCDIFLTATIPHG